VNISETKLDKYVNKMTLRGKGDRHCSVRPYPSH